MSWGRLQPDWQAKSEVELSLGQHHLRWWAKAVGFVGGGKYLNAQNVHWHLLI
jgi:hypothetical protein